MDIPRVDAWALHCLAVLVRERNVTRAGASLGLTQPATSAVLAKLRVLFQDPLLVKSASGMVPTPRAAELASRAEKVLGDLRAMTSSNSLRALPVLEASVSIAAMDLVRVLVLPQILNALQRDAPGLSITIHDADRVRIYERFEKAEIDLGIGPQVVSSASMHFRELWSDDGVCLVHEGHPALAQLPTPEAFATLTHVSVASSRPSFYDDALDKALQAKGLRRNIRITERSFLMVPRLLECSDLVAIVPGRFALDACRRHSLRTFEPPVRLPPLSMGLYWHERTHRDPTLQWLRQHIVKNFPVAGAIQFP